MRSTASLLEPYGLFGAVAASTVIGTADGSPYTAAVDEKTSLPTPLIRIASSSASVPDTFVAQYRSGTFTDSPTSDLPAKCITPSKRPADSTEFASVIGAWMSSAPSGTASAWPVERSSSTVTWWPASSKRAAATLPM